MAGSTLLLLEKEAGGSDHQPSPSPSLLVLTLAHPITSINGPASAMLHLDAGEGQELAETLRLLHHGGRPDDDRLRRRTAAHPTRRSSPSMN